MYGGFKIFCAMSGDTVREACRLRYDVFVREGGDGRYADHAQQLHIDAWDIPSSHFFVAQTREGEVIGTARLILRREGAYLGDRDYGYAHLSTITGMDLADLHKNSGILTRVAVAQRFRSRGVFHELHQSVERHARDLGLGLLLVVVGSGNNTGFNTFLKLGYILYHEAQFPSGWSGQCLFKKL